MKNLRVFITNKILLLVIATENEISYNYKKMGCKFKNMQLKNYI